MSACPWRNPDLLGGSSFGPHRNERMTDPHSRHKLRRRPLGRYRYVRWRWRVMFAAIDTVGRLAFGAGRAVQSLLGLLPHEKTVKPPDDPGVILLVQLDHMGDAVLSTAMLSALRDRYPQARIEVLAGAWNRELFEAMAEVDQVHASRLNRFWRSARLGIGSFGSVASTFWWGWTLRLRKVDLGIDVRGEFPLALILWLCGARRRLGWDSGGGGFLLTDSPRFVPDRAEVDSRLALLAELGIRPSGRCEMRRPAFVPSRQASRRVAQQLAGLRRQNPAEGGLFVLHVGAGSPAKQWPARHWRELIGRIVVRHGVQVVLVGSNDECIIAGEILQGQPWPGVADWTGRLGVVELAALIEQADVFVGCDSGPAHLAAAVGTPVVVLFGGTNNPRQWKPCGKQVTVVRHPVDCSPCHRRRCPLPDHPCMSRLEPATVAEAIEQLHGRASCRTPGPEAKGPAISNRGEGVRP